MFTLGETVGIVIAAFAFLATFVGMSRTARSEFWEKTEVGWHIFTTVFAIYYLASFVLKAASPDRLEILMAIVYFAVFISGPKAIVDGIFLRREQERVEKRTEMFNRLNVERSKQSKDD